MNNEITSPESKDLVLFHLSWAKAMMIQAKSEQRTDRDRLIAIAITDLEKVMVWWQTVVAGEGLKNYTSSTPPSHSVFGETPNN